MNILLLFICGLFLGAFWKILFPKLFQIFPDLARALSKNEQSIYTPIIEMLKAHLRILFWALPISVGFGFYGKVLEIFQVNTPPEHALLSIGVMVAVFFERVIK